MKSPRILALLVPALLGFALFLQVLPGDFVYDDRSLISLNPSFQHWEVIPQAFVTPYWELVDASRFSSGFFRPIGASVLALCWQLGQGEPLLFHFVSVFLHAACAMAVAAFALSFGWKPWLAGGAGVLFALSGVHAEPVAWISAIPDLLATFFSLLAMRAFVRQRFLSMACILFLGMLCKESALGIWLLLITLGLFSRRRKELGACLLVGLGVYALRVHAFDSWAAGFDRVTTHHGLSLVEQLKLSLSLVYRYLGFLLWPWPHAPFRPLALDSASLQQRIYPAIAGGLALFVALLTWLKRQNSSATARWGLGILGASLFPILNTQALGQYPFEERFLYLPSVGFSLLLAHAIFLASKQRTGIATSLLLLVGIPNAWSAWVGSRPWASEEALFTWARKVSPNAMTSHIEYGRLMVEYAQQTSDPLRRDMYTERALEAYRRSLEVDPDAFFVTTVEREKGNLGLGDALYLAGDFKAAEAVYRQTVDHYQISPLGYLGLANCRGQAALKHLREEHPTLADDAFEEALQYFDAALQQSPGLTNAVIGKAHALAQLGRYEEAQQFAEHGLQLAPNRLDVAELLFSIYYQQQNLPQALKVLRDFQRANPHHPRLADVQQTIAGVEAMMQQQ